MASFLKLVWAIPPVAKSKNNRIPVILAAIIIAIVLYAIAIASGAFTKQTSMQLSVSLDSEKCNGTAAIAIELKDIDGKRVPDALVDIYAGNNRLDSLYTDNNGRIRTDIPLESSWCGLPVNFSARYAGDYYHLASADSEIKKIKMPTRLVLDIPVSAFEGEITASAILTNAINGAPIADKEIKITYNATNPTSTTNSSGSASFSFVFDFVGSERISASFIGDEDYEPSSAEGTIEIMKLACAGGTNIGSCSGQYLCTENLTLEFSCLSCGCPSGLLCIDNQCISEEQRVERLIADLQNSTVQVQSDEAIGSGVIISLDGTKVVLTNRHVVDPDFIFSSPPNLEVKGANTEIAKPLRIVVAPNDLDMAIIFLDKDLGPPVELHEGSISRGADVLVLGSPLGLQNTVSRGIVSNFMNTATESGYPFQAIQTDAAVNPGNSGGGVFLASSGELIGITTFKLALMPGELAEGLGFAVPVSLLNESEVGGWRTVRIG